MAAQLNPYIHFLGGTAREAMEFYRDALGGALTMSTFGDFGQNDPQLANLIMHATLATPGGATLMGADTPPEREQARSAGITISLSGDNEAELRGCWDKLTEGADVTMPLDRQVWGDLYGQFTDRYGIEWMINIASGAASQ